MVNDLIHLTEGEFLIKYWWLYAVLVVIAIALSIYERTYKKKHPQKPFDIFKED